MISLCKSDCFRVVAQCTFPGRLASEKHAQPALCHEKFTIRFEDDMLLTPNGVELMSTLPRELI